MACDAGLLISVSDPVIVTQFFHLLPTNLLGKGVTRDFDLVEGLDDYSILKVQELGCFRELSCFVCLVGWL